MRRGVREERFDLTLAAGDAPRPLRDPLPARRGRHGGGLPRAGHRLGREVAIKVLPAAFASDPERLKRFEHEARSASSLNHPNIVTIHDIGSSDSVSYIAMELVSGAPLRASWREAAAGAPAPADRARRWPRGWRRRTPPGSSTGT